MPEILFRVIVDYGKSLEEMIAAGKYDYVDGNITKEHFPIKQKGKVELNMALVCFNLDRRFHSDEAVIGLNKQKLRPATLSELLAFGATICTEKHEELSVVALGSSWDFPYEDSGVPHFSNQYGKRYLTLPIEASAWDTNTLFLAVRE